MLVRQTAIKQCGSARHDEQGSQLHRKKPDVQR